MSLGDRMARAVDRRLARLREAYDDFPVVTETVENDPERFERGRRLAASGWLGDAGAWVTDDAGHALLVRHADDPDRWGVPGGGHEPGERFAETARREVREETGVTCEVVGVVRARRRTIRHADEPDRRLAMLTVVFEADYRGDRLDVGDDEILEARWFAPGAPPERVYDLVESRVREWAEG